MAELQPALVQLWTNGRPVPTGTLVPVEGATLRILLMYLSEEGEVVRYRSEVTDILKGKVNTSDPEVVVEETAHSMAELFSLAVPVGLEPNHLLWRVEKLGDIPHHWGQNLAGSAARIVPVDTRDTGDGLLGYALEQAGVVPPFGSYYPELSSTEGVYVALNPPRLGHNLRAFSGVRFLRSNVTELYSAERELLDAATRRGKQEVIANIQASAWS